MTNIDAIRYLKKGSKTDSLVVFDKPKTLKETRKLAYRFLTDGEVKTTKIKDKDFSMEYQVVYLCRRARTGYVIIAEVMKQYDGIMYRDYSLAGTILNVYVLHSDGSVTKYNHEKTMEKARKKFMKNAKKVC